MKIDQRRIDEIIENEWLGLGDTSLIEVPDLFASKTQDDIENPAHHLISIMRNPDYFGFTCQYLFGKTLAPFQLAILKELWYRPMPMLIGSRGMSKSWLLAIYSLLRATFDQGSKVVIVGSVFRQSKVVFEYCEEIWNSAPVFRDFVGQGTKNRSNGPKHAVDRWVFRIGDSFIAALPLGTGASIRGQRATHVICEEFASISVDIYENVIKGFSAVSADPVKNMQIQAKKRALKKLGAEDVEEGNYRFNQSIISGTAYYAFNHFAEYHRRYKAIIESRGDAQKFEAAIGSKPEPGINWKDFSIIRIPYELLPDGFMDARTIASAKATVSTGNFGCEYQACHAGDTLITTDKGLTPISQVVVGDNVLTHKGRFRPVTQVFKRPYSGKVIKWKTVGGDQFVFTTPEHLFWDGADGWIPINDLSGAVYLPTLDSNGNMNSIGFDIQKESVLYDGSVYNLEVEEDHSYCLPTAATHNCFISDSNGFFRRSLVESCVVGKMGERSIVLPTSGLIDFTHVIHGHPGRKYVMAIDPASESDNFSIVILEVWPDHRRIVYCWTTNRKAHNARVSRGLSKYADYYGACARKIRDLLRAFHCERIAIDGQGGGVAVYEALHDPDKMEPGEVPLWEVIDPDKEKESDRFPGNHLIEIIQFSRADWVSGANHGMKKDFEDKVLLFPRFDSAMIGLSYEEDKESGRVRIADDGTEEKLYDTLEDCVLEIEELKDELASIIHTQTINGRDRWDTPETKKADGKKGRLRKDRYSALLMANMVARQLARMPAPPEYHSGGGFAKDLAGKKTFKKSNHQNPEWYQQRMNQGGYGAVSRRRPV